MAYTVKIETVDKTSLIKAGSLSFSRLANHDDSLSCVIITTAATYLPLEGQDIQVWDGTEFVFGGVIDTINIDKIESGLGSTKKLLVSISSAGYKSICRRRTTTSTWQGKTAGYIINALITSILSGEGITGGAISDGALVGDAEGYYEAVCKNCSEILDDMAQASGMVWWIDGDKKLNFLDFSTVINVPHQLLESAGRTFTDFEIESYTKDMSTYANRVFVRGGIGDDGLVVSTSESDTDEITARIAVEGGTGVYGYVLEDDNITILADATTAAVNYLKKSAIIPQTLIFTSMTLTYWYPGFRLTVNLPTLGISTNTYFVIEEVGIEDIDGKNLQVRIRATSRKGSDFSTQANQTGIEYLTKVVSSAKKTTTIGSGGSGVFGGGNIYVDTSFPIDAPNKSVLIDTDDYSRFDKRDISTGTLLVVEDDEYIKCIGTAPYSVTLHSATQVGVIKYIKNLSNGLITIIGTIDGETNAYLYPKESVLLITNGTAWDRIGD
jgi:hypothetical protein